MRKMVEIKQVEVEKPRTPRKPPEPPVEPKRGDRRKRSMVDRRKADERKGERRSGDKRQKERRKNWRGQIEYADGWQDKGGRRKAEGERRGAQPDRRQKDERTSGSDRRQSQRRTAERRGTSGREFVRHTDHENVRMIAEREISGDEGVGSVGTRGVRTEGERNIGPMPTTSLPEDVHHARLNPARWYSRASSKISDSAAIKSLGKKHPEDNFVPLGEVIARWWKKPHPWMIWRRWAKKKKEGV